MKTKGILKRILFVSGTLVGVFIFAFGIWYYNPFVISVFDRPWFLSNKRESIEVAHIHWLCDRADFIETKYYKPDVGQTVDSQNLFIEPAQPELKVPDSFYEQEYFEKNLRLTGQFYTDKRIPTSYELETPIKPDHARVFRYDKIEIVN